MKKVVFTSLIIIAVFFSVSCNDVKKTSAEKIKKSVEVELLPESALDNNTLRAINGKVNITNSLERIAYPWHHGWAAEYEKLEMDKNPGLPTNEQSIAAYKIENAENMSDVFYSLPVENEWKWLTQSQVVEFCLSNRSFIKNSRRDIVFFCKKDEKKMLYERNLEEEVVAIIVVPRLGGETRMMLGVMWYGSPIGGCTVIVAKNEIGVVKY